MIEYFKGAQHDPAARPRWWVWALIKIGWLAAGPGAIVLAAVALEAGTHSGAGYLLPLFLMLVLTCLAMLIRTVRKARAMVAVNYLEQAVRLNLPIPAMLAAAQRCESGGVRRRLARINRLLETGAPVGLAMQSALPGVPPRVAGVVLAGERLGRLPAALRRAVSQEWRLFDRRPAQAIFLRWYPLIFLLFLCVVSSLMTVMIMPSALSCFDFRVTSMA